MLQHRPQYTLSGTPCLETTYCCQPQHRLRASLSHCTRVQPPLYHHSNANCLVLSCVPLPSISNASSLPSLRYFQLHNLNVNTLSEKSYSYLHCSRTAPGWRQTTTALRRNSLQTYHILLSPEAVSISQTIWLIRYFCFRPPFAAFCWSFFLIDLLTRVILLLRVSRHILFSFHHIRLLLPPRKLRPPPHVLCHQPLFSSPVSRSIMLAASRASFVIQQEVKFQHGSLSAHDFCASSSLQRSFTSVHLPNTYMVASVSCYIPDGLFSMYDRNLWHPSLRPSDIFVPTPLQTFRHYQFKFRLCLPLLSIVLRLYPIIRLLRYFLICRAHCHHKISAVVWVEHCFDIDIIFLHSDS